MTAFDLITVVAMGVLFIGAVVVPATWMSLISIPNRYGATWLVRAVLFWVLVAVSHLFRVDFAKQEYHTLYSLEFMAVALPMLFIVGMICFLIDFAREAWSKKEYYKFVATIHGLFLVAGGIMMVNEKGQPS